MQKAKRTLNRRDFLSLAGSATALALTGCATGAPRTARQDRLPNFIVVFCDDLGYNDLGCFGSPLIKTPNIDRVAAEGMRFTDFYAAAPVCTPSRAALMTGCYPQRVGLASPAVVLGPASTTGINPDEITIAEILKQRGYATACIGKWHLGHLPMFLPTRNGFDHYFGIPYSNDMGSIPLLRDEEIVEHPVQQGTLTERYTQEAIQFITANQDKPFFLYIPHTFPHTPLHVSEQFKDKSARGLYGDVVECIDWSVGQIDETLRKLGLHDNTLVVFSSDNGPWLVFGDRGGSAFPLRAGKGTTYEGGMREPCIMRWPRKIPAGSVCSEMATTMDILPTFARLAGGEVPTDRIIDGKDIWPLMSGQRDAKSPHEAFYYYYMDDLQAVRSGDWKLVFERRKFQEHPYHKPTPEASEIVPEALYNLRQDIGEQFNVIEQHPDVAQRLRQLADKMRDDLGDMPGPLLGTGGTKGRNRRPVGKA